MNYYRGNIVRLITTAEPMLNSFNSIGNFSRVLGKRSPSTGDRARGGGGQSIVGYVCEYLERAMSQNGRNHISIGTL